MAQITTSAETIVAIETTEVASTTRMESVKDAGRVRVGAGMMRFDLTKDSGRVRVGAGMMRF